MHLCASFCQVCKPGTSALHLLVGFRLLPGEAAEEGVVLGLVAVLVLVSSFLTGSRRSFPVGLSSWGIRLQSCPCICILWWLSLSSTCPSCWCVYTLVSIASYVCVH